MPWKLLIIPKKGRKTKPVTCEFRTEWKYEGLFLVAETDKWHFYQVYLQGKPLWLMMCAPDHKDTTRRLCSRNPCGGTVAATIGNFEHFWCSWNSISNHCSVVVMKGYEEIGSLLEKMVSSVYNHRAKIKITWTYFSQSIIWPKSALIHHFIFPNSFYCC